MSDNDWAAETTEENEFLHETVEISLEDAKKALEAAERDMFPSDAEDYVNLVGRQSRRVKFLTKLRDKIGGK